jgi:superoxide dismutase
MTCPQKKRKHSNAKTNNADKCLLKCAIVKRNAVAHKVRQQNYVKRNAEAIKKRQQDYEKRNAEAIKKRKQDYRKRNAEAIKKRQQDYRQHNAEAVKVSGQDYRKRNAEALKVAQFDRRKRNAAQVKKGNQDYSKRKAEKKREDLDAIDKLQLPPGRKTLSRATIKKAIRDKFRFGKTFVDVQNCEGKWRRVKGPRFFRVFIAVNDAGRIRRESTVPFYGKAAWLVQVQSVLISLVI